MNPCVEIFSFLGISNPVTSKKFFIVTRNAELSILLLSVIIYGTKFLRSSPQTKNACYIALHTYIGCEDINILKRRDLKVKHFNT